MSKSRGTGISPLRYLEVGMNPEWLRYYIAAKLNAQRRGPRLQPRGLHRAGQQRPDRQVRQHRRAAPRTSSPGTSAASCSTAATPRALAPRRARTGRIRARSLRSARVRHARIREVMAFADRINQDFDAHQPWVLAKDAGQGARSCRTSARARSTASRCCRCCSPRCCRELARRAARGAVRPRRPTSRWADAAGTARQRISPYQHLMTRVDAKQLDALFDADRPRRAAKAAATQARSARRRQRMPAPPPRHRRSTSSSASTCAWRASCTPSWSTARTSS